MLLQTLINDYAAPELTTAHPLLLITVTRALFRMDGSLLVSGHSVEVAVR
jgi:hypothetical protein